MQLIRLEQFEPPAPGSAVALGYYDGIHLGHRRIVARTVALARENGLRSLLFTFEDHPLVLLRPERPPLLLTTLVEKARLLEGTGLDGLVYCSFTQEFSRQTPEAFARRVLVDALRIRFAVIGPNYHFGHKGAGTPETLASLGESLGFRVEVSEPVSSAGAMVSSSRVRTLVTEGAVREASGLLGQPYLARGMVVHGERRGRRIGFPTANIAVSPRKLLPAQGVYAAWLVVANRPLPCVANLGRRPTFDGQGVLLEAHVLDFKGDLYGQELDILFVERLRGEMRFNGAGELSEQIRKDILQARRILVHPPALGGGQSQGEAT